MSDQKLKYESKTPKRGVGFYIRMLNRKTGIFIFQLIVSAVLVVAIAYWGYVQILRQSLGGVRLFSWKKAVVSIYGQPKVLLINPLRTQRFLLPPDSAVTDTEYWPYKPRNDNWIFADTLWYAKEIEKKNGTEVEVWKLIGTYTEKQATLIDYWEDILLKGGISYELKEEPILSDLDSSYNLIIIPSALLLSKSERQGIKDYVAKGGNVLLCWSTGCRWETGEWAGFDFLSQLIGGLPSGDITDPAGSTSFILRGNSPITASIAPGTHLDYFLYDGYVSFELMESRTVSDAFLFTPYWRTPKQAAAQSRCVLAHGSYLKGRFVWMAFSPSAVQEHKKDNKNILDKVVNNSIDWLIGKPIISPQIWPKGYHSAAALILYIDSNDIDVNGLLKQVNANGIILDVLVDPAKINPNMRFNDVSFGELGIVYNEKNPTVENDAKMISRWLISNSETLENVFKKPVKILHPKNWAMNEILLRATANAKVDLVLGCLYPRFYGGREVFVRHSRWAIFSPSTYIATVPKSQLSLSEWMLASEMYRNISPYNGVFEDFRRISYTGGMYIGIFETSALAKLKKTDLIYELANEMDTKGTWRSNVYEIAKRFAVWEWLKVKRSIVSSNRIKIDISNIGDERFSDIVFYVYLPEQFKKIEASAIRLGSTPTSVSYNSAQGYFSFILPKLSPNENTTIFLDISE